MTDRLRNVQNIVTTSQHYYVHCGKAAEQSVEVSSGGLCRKVSTSSAGRLKLSDLSSSTGPSTPLTLLSTPPSLSLGRASEAGVPFSPPHTGKQTSFTVNSAGFELDRVMVVLSQVRRRRDGTRPLRRPHLVVAAESGDR